MRYASKKDANQNEIVRVLEKAGCAITDLSGVGEGVTDILCTRAGIHYLIEIKSAKGKLRDSQVDFHAKHHPVYTVRTIDQALRAVGLKK